ncbi:chemotaxis protein CheX [Roseburia sp. 499]|uniref:chemotaxis protein CheX n=1 Tax=Roseburia sp. 499 TaxID=1261634 RepID=UPI0009515E10|nr:chemotaxis protein CheX [Roseburia sp. 499]WVK71519.1 chemotaxis protein CheX [Roseburia sp. 499]
MYTQFFGNFLINKGIITAEQLMEALKIQSSAHQKLGTLAIHEGYMSANEVEDVYIMQTHYDKRFGELAIKLGYLTQKQVNELLKLQLPDYMKLGQVLIDQNLITNTDLENLVAEYRSAYEIYDLNIALEQQELVDKLLSSFCSQENITEPERLIPYLTLLFNNLIRFIGEDFTPLDIIPMPEIPINFCVYQEIEGTLLSALDMEPQTAIAFANKYVGDTFTELDEYVQASVEDFLNLHNGLYTVNMSNEHSVELKLEPPMVQEHPTLSTDSLAYLLPIVYPFGRINFIISLM